MKRQTTAAAIHDLSGIGKCSLTAALPVLSAAGVSCSALPTAILSTQTGGLRGYFYRDLTGDMNAIINHWKTLGLKFDAVYSGFLGSENQVETVLNFVDEFSKENSIYLCDPAMADGGKLYATFNDSFVSYMKKLCLKADIIVPNVTECFFLLDEDYKRPPYSVNFVYKTAKKLSNRFRVKDIVITGVEIEPSKIFKNETSDKNKKNFLGSCAYNARKDEFSLSLRPRMDGTFHSAGDLFASSLLGAVLNGFSIDKSCEKASEFTVNSIERTVKEGGDSRFGLNFEKCIPDYIRSLNLLKN